MEKKAGLPLLHFLSSSGTLLPFPPFPFKLFLIKECFPVDGRVLQFFHVLLHLFVGDFRINLRGLDAQVSHHAGHRLNRDTQRKRDMGTEIMPGLVKGQRKAVCLSQFRNEREEILAAIKVEHLVAVSLVFVLLDYFHRDVQQPDRGQRVRLLPPVVYPPCAVFRLRDVVRLQTFQVGKRQAGETRKKHQSKGDRF